MKSWVKIVLLLALLILTFIGIIKPLRELSQAGSPKPAPSEPKIMYVYDRIHGGRHLDGYRSLKDLDSMVDDLANVIKSGDDIDVELEYEKSGRAAQFRANTEVEVLETKGAPLNVSQVRVIKAIPPTLGRTTPKTGSVWWVMSATLHPEPDSSR